MRLAAEALAEVALDVERVLDFQLSLAQRPESVPVTGFLQRVDCLRSRDAIGSEPEKLLALFPDVLVLVIVEVEALEAGCFQVLEDEVTGVTRSTVVREIAMTEDAHAVIAIVRLHHAAEGATVGRVELALNSEGTAKHFDESNTAGQALLVDPSVCFLVDLDTDRVVVQLRGMKHRLGSKVGNAADRAIGVDDQMSATAQLASRPEASNGKLLALILASLEELLRGLVPSARDAFCCVDDDGPNPAGSALPAIFARASQLGIVEPALRLEARDLDLLTIDYDSAHSFSFWQRSGPRRVSDCPSESTTRAAPLPPTASAELL